MAVSERNKFFRRGPIISEKLDPGETNFRVQIKCDRTLIFKSQYLDLQTIYHQEQFTRLLTWHNNNILWDCLFGVLGRPTKLT